MLRLAHIGIHSPGNAGDTVLFVVVRRLFEYYLGDIHWTLINLWDAVDQEMIDKINATQGLIIGGGGLFLKDTNVNELSGWQWACPVSVLETIRVPIIIFGVGYNRFRGQDEFETEFKRSINWLVGNAAFFGLRNSGSVEQVSNYIDNNNSSANKEIPIVFQPCPTTLLYFLYPELWQKHKPQTGKPRVVLNAAFDRQKHRYGERFRYVINSFSRIAQWLTANEYRVDVVCHCGADGALLPPMYNTPGIKFTRVNLDYINWRSVLDYYMNAHLVIGMRGHSQLIPFGMRKKILSVISHDKLKYFLQDIGHEEWGMEISNPGLAEGIIHKIKFMDRKDKQVDAQIANAQSKLWDITKENMGRIKRILFKGVARRARSRPCSPI